MKQYFKKFPKIQYPYTDSNGRVYNLTTVDLSIRFKIIEKILQTPNSYYEYYWKDSDRVDIVADKYYGNPDLSWVIMLSAEVFDWLYDLPIREDLFDDYLKQKYEVEDTTDLHQKLHHYEDISGTIIDENTYLFLADFNKKEVSVYEYEFNLNEQKRNVKLLSKSLLSDMLNEYDTRLQEIKNSRRLLGLNYDQTY